MTVQPGTNLVADQLYQVDDNVLYDGLSYGWPMNTLNALFNPYPWATSTGGAVVLKWNGQGFDAATNSSPFSSSPWCEPIPQGGDITMLPGTSVMMINTNSNSFPVSFVGLVREQQVFQIQSKTNFLSATVPIAGALTTITGYVPHNGDTIQLWRNGAFVSHKYTANGWSNGVPVLDVGEGFVLIATQTNYTWTNTWRATACASP